MAINPLGLARISNQFRANMVNRTITNTQKSLAQVQQELSTGRKLNTPSDNPDDAASSQQIRRLLEQRDAWLSNLKSSTAQLNLVDSTLGSIEDQLRDAQTTASSTVGTDTTADGREAAALVVDSIYSQILSLANTSSEGVYFFAGDRSTAAPFEEQAGGVKWVGSDRLLQNTVDESKALTFMANGAEIFGALSTRVTGRNDLTPTISSTTRLSDMRGAGGFGVRLGTIQIDNGTDRVDIDLTGSDSIDDVVEKINASNLAGITASSDATGLTIGVDAGFDVSITDIGGGNAASDLGILASTPGDGVDVVGVSLDAKITMMTPLSLLNAGAGINQSGLTITNGLITKNIDFSGATTVGDMINSINSSGVNVSARINSAGDGIDILNSVQGVQMTIAENGGTTAADLGVRSFDEVTKLNDLNSGAGVGLVEGAELRITDSNGVAFDVELDGLETTQDVIDAINNAAITAGAGVTAAFQASANGLELTDTAAGAGTLSAVSINNSIAAQELGLDVAAISGVINGRDVAPVESNGIFANLNALRNAMRDNDQAAMTRAAEKLDFDLKRVISNHGKIGAMVKEFESRTERMEDQNVATKSVLADLEDSDYTEAISRFQMLQTSLQASMQTANTMLSTSLLDFLS
ncbi:MAG TPA: flagellin [Tepidisphaeraceae bacterium]|nr:flagellin [Tepidisphaeraceae bacterium]